MVLIYTISSSVERTLKRKEVARSRKAHTPFKSTLRFVCANVTAVHIEFVNMKAMSFCCGCSRKASKSQIANLEGLQKSTSKDIIFALEGYTQYNLPRSDL